MSNTALLLACAVFLEKRKHVINRVKNIQKMKPKIYNLHLKSGEIKPVFADSIEDAKKKYGKKYKIKKIEFSL
jgi:hypothetical protein